MIEIKKGRLSDVDKAEEIYNELFESEAVKCTGWIKGVYPTRDTLLKAFYDDKLYVLENDGDIVGVARIDTNQVDVYKNVKWKYETDTAFVLHTLVIKPSEHNKGFASKFVSFYEKLAKENGCRVLRMDTNAKNKKARALYKKLGYEEAGIVPCTFNGIPDVMLVCLEKKI